MVPRCVQGRRSKGSASIPKEWSRNVSPFAKSPGHQTCENRTSERSYSWPWTRSRWGYGSLDFLFQFATTRSHRRHSIDYSRASLSSTAAPTAPLPSTRNVHSYTCVTNEASAPRLQQSHKNSTKRPRKSDIMSQPRDPPLDTPPTAEIESLELFRRSPHPYLRRKDEIRTDRSAPPTRQSSQNRRKRRKVPSQSQSPSESGTEADDEAYTFVKALPPPPLRPHKGLREGARSPLLTPTQIDDEGRKYSEEYFAEKKRSRRGEGVVTDEEARLARQKYLQRRRMELVRRTTETALLVAIGVLAVGGCACWEGLVGGHRGKSPPLVNNGKIADLSCS